MTVTPYAAPLLALAGPLLLIAVGAIPSAVANRGGVRFANRIAWAAALAFFASLALVAVRLLGGAAASSEPAGFARAVVLLDGLTLVMLTLVSFLVAVVTRYSVNYLAGDARQGHFMKWLALTGGAVLVLVVSGNFLQFTAAWMATSLCLHRLLTFFGDRPAAMLAARQKFLISRLGDLCMAGSLWLAWKCFGTFEFVEMFARADALREAGERAPLAEAMSVLIVAGALLKSAQFPFHSWLPDTMETPTPVSALMHAGIINAGGFLVVRLSPIVVHSPAALNSLALAGAITALFASVVMLTQTSIKRALAYSTVAQMGFMMLQCGLGAFAVAILHLVAHSLYKAHAFLSSGGIVQMSKSAWTPSERPSAHPLILGATLATAVTVTWIAGAPFQVFRDGGPGLWLLGLVFAMGAAYFLWNLWASPRRAELIAPGIGIAAGVAACHFVSHLVFERALAGAIPRYAPVRAGWEYGVMLAVALLFVTVLALQAQFPAWSASRLGRRIYVHASHGFYLGALANRLVRALNPEHEA
jgi:NAD(P)H-quinone oxidoreductase subunit 5